jgi:anti-sigma B factor antagonist
MSDIKISLDSSGPKGEISVVRVDGVIDTMTATDLEKVMNSLLERRRYNVIIDLGGVDYISSAGWGIFISNIREIRQHSGDIKLARMIPNVYEIFELLEFDSILKAFDSVEKAKTDFDGLKKSAVESEGVAVIAEAAAKVDTFKSIPKAPEAQSSSISPQLLSDPSEIKVMVDEPPVAPQPRDIILEMISKDPFLTISEIKREIRRKHPALRFGWWKIWGVLKRDGLLTRKNRFRKARLKTGGN